MDKKKIGILITIVIIILAIVIGILILVNNKKENTLENTTTEQTQNTKISKFYEKILDKKEMTFTKILDDNNKVFIAIKDNNAYKEITLNGKTQKYVVKEGETYLLDEKNKKYYKYQSNDIILTEVREQFEELNNKSILEGKEKIDGKTYNYAEISGYQGFLFNDELGVNDLSRATTKLYFDGDELNYIKTIAGDNEELLKVEVSYKSVDEDYFVVPDDFSNGREE